MSKEDIQEINVLDIYLDPENPRHDSTKEQDKIIEFLLTEQVWPLAKDIAENGTSPLELVGVFKDASGRYIALEGNRRLCALTLLNDPNLSPSNYKKQFQKLSKEYSIPSTISAVVFKSRKSADKWLERRHTGQQGGIGVKNWSAQQQTRFNTRNQKADDNALALGLIEYASKQGLISDSDAKKRLTTATRYLGNPFFRKTLGVVSKRNNPNIELNVAIDDFNIGLNKFFQDLIENKEVNSRTKRTDWEEYAKKLSREGYAPQAHINKYQLSSPPKPANRNNQENTNTTPQGRVQPNPIKRPNLFDSKFRPAIKNKTLRGVFNEIKSLNVDDNPLSVTLLTRVFYENVLRLYKEINTGRFDGDGNSVLNEVIKLLENNRKNSLLSREQITAFSSLRKISGNGNHILSFKSLGADAHTGTYPSSRELKTQWDHIEPIILYMLEEIANHK